MNWSFVALLIGSTLSIYAWIRTSFFDPVHIRVERHCTQKNAYEWKCWHIFSNIQFREFTLTVCFMFEGLKVFKTQIYNLHLIWLVADIHCVLFFFLIPLLSRDCNLSVSMVHDLYVSILNWYFRTPFNAQINMLLHTYRRLSTMFWLYHHKMWMEFWNKKFSDWIAFNVKWIGQVNARV